jgi:hypothetical protein
VHARVGGIGLDELNRLGQPHGIRFFDDWIADLKAAYNVRVIGEERRVRGRGRERRAGTSIGRWLTISWELPPLPRPK